ncbi:hypothetical protein OESDEN_00350, partial [Oesophagostomum dentatum]
LRRYSRPSGRACLQTTPLQGTISQNRELKCTRGNEALRYLHLRIPLALRILTKTHGATTSTTEAACQILCVYSF